MAVASYITGGIGPASNTVALYVTKGLGIGEAVAVTLYIGLEVTLPDASMRYTLPEAKIEATLPDDD